MTTRQTTPQSQFDPGTLERIELAFPDLLGSFEVHERDLELDGRPVAHWLASSQGRTLLVSVVDGRDESAVLRALDGLACVRTQPEMLARQLPETRNSAPQLRVLLVAVDGFSALQQGRLCALDSQELGLFVRRELCTQRGTHTRLEAAEIGNGTPAATQLELPDWAQDAPFSSFLARVAPARLELVLTTLERIRRLDPQFAWSDSHEELACRFQGIELFHLSWAEHALELVFDRDHPSLTIRDEPGLERAIEQLLGVYLQALTASEALEPASPPRGLTGSTPLTPRSAALPPEFQSADETSSVALLDEDEFEPLEDFDEGELKQIEMHPMPPGPLLTREEIQAFQD